MKILTNSPILPALRSFLIARAKCYKKQEKNHQKYKVNDVVAIFLNKLQYLSIGEISESYKERLLT